MRLQPLRQCRSDVLLASAGPSNPPLFLTHYTRPEVKGQIADVNTWLDLRFHLCNLISDL
jgi:hypothetical protein